MSTCTPWLKSYVLRALSPTTTAVSSLDGSYLQVISTVGGRRQVVVYDGAHTAAAVLSHAAATRLDADEDDLGVTTRNLVGHLVAPVAAVVVPDASTTPPTATLVLQDVRVFADQVAQRPPGKLPAVDRDPDVLDCLRASVGRKLAAFATRSSFVREMEEVETAGAVGLDALDEAFEDVLDNPALPPAGLLDGLGELGGLGVDAGAGTGAGTGAGAREGGGEGPVGEGATERQDKAGLAAADAGASEASEGSVRDREDDGDEMPELQMHAVLGMENGGREGDAESGAGQGNRGDKEVRKEAAEGAVEEEGAREGQGAETEDFGDWEIRFSSQEQAEAEAEAEAEADGGGGADELCGDEMPLTQHFPIEDEAEEGAGEGAEEGEGLGAAAGGEGAGSEEHESAPPARQGTAAGVANYNGKSGALESRVAVDPSARAGASAAPASDPSVTAGRADAAAASANTATAHRSRRVRGMDPQSHAAAAAQAQEDMGNAAAKPAAPLPAAPATEVTADTANSMTHGSAETREGDDARAKHAPEPRPSHVEGVPVEDAKLPGHPHAEAPPQQNGNAVPAADRAAGGVEKPVSPAEEPPAADAMDVDLPDPADPATQPSVRVPVTEATETLASPNSGSADGAAKTVSPAQTAGEGEGEGEGAEGVPAGQKTATGTAAASATAADTVGEAQPSEKRGAKRRPPTPVENDELHRKQLRTDAQQPLTTEKALDKLRREVNLLRAFREKVDENPTAFVLNPDSFLPRLPGSGGATKENVSRGDAIAFPPPEVRKVTMDGSAPSATEVVSQIPDSAPI